MLATAEDAGRAMDMFHGYSWQTRVLEVRPDRLPPDFDNLLGNSGGAVGGFNVSGSPISLGLAVASAGVGAPSDGGFSMSSSLENYDHNSLFGLDRPGSSSNGGRNLFVGNVSEKSKSHDHSLNNNKFLKMLSFHSIANGRI